MNNLIESIADFEKLAKSGLVCLVDQKEESVHYLVGTTNEELIHYFCKNHVSRTIHTPEELEVDKHQLKFFDILAREFVPVELATFHGYSFNVASATPPEMTIETDGVVDFNTAVTVDGNPVQVINEISGTEFCFVIAYGSKTEPKVATVNQFGVTPDGEKILCSKSDFRLMDVVIVISKMTAPSFVPLDKETVDKFKANRTEKNAVMFASAVMGRDEQGKEVPVSIHLLQDKPVL